MQTQFLGSVQKGEFKLDQINAFNELLKSLEGKRIALTLKAHRKPRTVPQNAYYWGVVIRLIAESMGHRQEKGELEEVHNMLRMKFLTVHRDNYPPTIKSTTQLNTSEFEEYLSNIREWAGSFFNGLYIPLPHEVTDLY